MFNLRFVKCIILFDHIIVCVLDTVSGSGHYALSGGWGMNREPGDCFSDSAVFDTFFNYTIILYNVHIYYPKLKIMNDIN